MATPDEYLAFAHLLADEAGAVLRRHFRRPLVTDAKADGSPVTEADREAEAAMRSLIRSRYPEHGIFGEEWERENIHSPLQWVLDPIDGTRAFLAGYPTFTTLIGLAQNGVPVAGIIDQPYLKERWAGLRKAPSNATANVPQNTAIATTSLTYFTPAQAKAFGNATKGHMVVHGGDAYAYAMLAEGRLHAVIDAALKPYDFCAVIPVVEAAGCIVTDWHGKPLTLQSDGEVLAACNAQVHAIMLERLKA